jgi:hypothetical protein
LLVCVSRQRRGGVAPSVVNGAATHTHTVGLLLARGGAVAATGALGQRSMLRGAATKAARAKPSSTPHAHVQVALDFVEHVL